MGDALSKRMLMMKLSEELAELDEKKEDQQEKEFAEKLKALLDEYDYSFADLYNNIQSVMNVTQATPAKTPKDSGAKTKRTPKKVEYKGTAYTVNPVGRQPAETKELLDELSLSAAEFISLHSNS